LEAAAKALYRVGIPEKLFERTDSLSGGQQQRVAIARVLVQDPIAILADEPVASLDPQLSREIMDLLCGLASADGKTLVVSIHSIELAKSHFDRIIGLRAGQVFFDLPAAQVSNSLTSSLYQR
jgi:phosphonate transport system ATP-binding protein